MMLRYKSNYELSQKYHSLEIQFLYHFYYLDEFSYQLSTMKFGGIIAMAMAILSMASVGNAEPFKWGDDKELLLR